MKNLIPLLFLISVISSCKKDEEPKKETSSIGYYIEMPIKPNTGDTDFVKITYADGKGNTKDTTFIGPDADWQSIIIEDFPYGATAMMKVETNFPIGKHTITADIYDFNRKNNIIVATGNTAENGQKFTIYADINKE